MPDRAEGGVRVDGVGEDVLDVARVVKVRTTSLVNSSTEKNAVDEQGEQARRSRPRPATASAGRAARPAVAAVPDTTTTAAATRGRQRRHRFRRRRLGGCCHRHPPGLEPAEAGSRPASVRHEHRLAVAQVAPGLGPLRVRDALDVGATVEAVALRSGPEPDLLEVRLVGRVEGRRRGPCRSVSAQAFGLAGASPNHSATCAWMSGFVIQFIHMYAQFGCGDLASIIQVSAQPVAPSFGQDRVHRSLVALGQVHDDLPRRADHRRAVLERLLGVGVGRPVRADAAACCALTRSTAASNCFWSSAYGFLMPRSGLVAIR